MLHKRAIQAINLPAFQIVILREHPEWYNLRVVEGPDCIEGTQVFRRAVEDHSHSKSYIAVQDCADNAAKFKLAVGG